MILCVVTVVAERRKGFHFGQILNTSLIRIHFLPQLLYGQRYRFRYQHYHVYLFSDCSSFPDIYMQICRLFNLSTEKRRCAPLATLLRLASWRISWLLLSWLLVACNSVMPGRDHSRSHHFLSPKQQHALLRAQRAQVSNIKWTLFVQSFLFDQSNYKFC